MTHLVIVESPAKCQKIQGFLGAGWRVIATMGHIRALSPELKSVGLDCDFEAKYEWLKTKSKAIQQLKEEAKKATEIYLASDDDREGEGISYAVCLLLKLNPNTVKRSVFHEITEKAVKHAIANPRKLDLHQVHAQQTRSILDMMIGFTMSPLLWRYVAPALSAGRCQTPALRLVVDREDRIQSFQSSSSWKVSAKWVGAKPYNSVMEDELEDEESAMNYMENVHNIPNGTIIQKDIKPWSESAPPPLITSTLQQQASALFGMNPKNTMQVAQKLYEAGHITYMRTDKAILSEEAIQEGKQWIQAQYGEEYLENPNKKPKAKPEARPKANEEVKAQEAHEAIRPTHMDIPEIEFDVYGRKLYHLIWQRAIQSIMANARGETCLVRTQIEGDTDFMWRSQWKRTLFPGWKRAGKVAELEEEEEEKEGGWEEIQALDVGTRVQWSMMIAEPKETKAQGRYTEATLVRELETFGIGRPSTFATLLAAIQDKNYVEERDFPPKEVNVKEYTISPSQWPPAALHRKKKVGGEKRKLVPTELGRSVLSYLLTHFEDLFTYDFTAHMERRLDHIAEGTEHEKQILRDIWASYRERYEALLSQPSIKGSAKIKEFGGGLKAVQSKKGPLILQEGKEDTQFLGWPANTKWEEITAEQAKAFQQEQQEIKKGITIGQWKDQPIMKKTGKFGDYLQCGTVSIPYQVEELEQTLQRLEAKTQTTTREFKEFSIRTGQYGPYIMKTSLKKPQFVSLPKGVDPSTLTEKEVEALYKLGLESKKKWKNQPNKNRKNNKE
jgi:DNA topoisomerase I